MSTEVRNITSQEGEWEVLLQVSTLPVMATIGQAVTTEMAVEEAAKCILHVFREMLISFSSSILL